MSWWDLGEWKGYPGDSLATYQIPCAFCGEVGNFETIHHLERKKPSNHHKALNYDTLKCGHCGNLMFAFWSAASEGYGNSSIHDYQLLPRHRSTTSYPKHWPDDVGRYWLEARRSIEGKNWIAAVLMARSAIQLLARSHGAQGKNLKDEIDDLAKKGQIMVVMRDFAHEIRELGNEGTHPRPGTEGTCEKDARDVVEFLGLMLTAMYDLPEQIRLYKKRKYLGD